MSRQVGPSNGDGGDGNGGVQLLRIGRPPSHAAQPDDAADNGNVGDAATLDETQTHQNAENGKSKTSKRNKPIDFVLTYQRHGSEAADAERDRMRRDLLTCLQDEGVIVEEAEAAESDEASGSCTRFLLLQATFPLLARYAEAIRLQMPLRDQSLMEAGEGQTVGGGGADSSSSSSSCRWSVWNAFRHPADNAGDKNDLFTAPFQKDRLEMFLVDTGTGSIEDAALAQAEGGFFTSAQRSLLLHTALVSLPAYTKCAAAGAIRESFPLHDGPHAPPPGGTSLAECGVSGCDNDRQELHLLWVSATNWWRFQPLMLIRRYFGEKVAMYFAWLGAYNMWLLPISIIGLAAFIFGLVTVATDETVDQICDNAQVGHLLMCPVCDRACSYWQLAESCTYSRIVHIFDNKASVLFAGLVSLWATCFLEFWKRRQCVLQYRWDVSTCEQDEVPRPEFTRSRIFMRASRYCFSLVTVLFMVALVLAVLIGVITYRVAMLIVFSSVSSLGVFMSHLRLITTGTAACINFVCIMLLNQVYKRLAMWLTSLERPRTETDFEDSYTVKMYCFQFVNYYSSLFYIAFVKGSFAGRPGEYSRYPMLGGVRLEECDPAGCQVELVVQMLIIFVAKQLLNCGTEVGPHLIRKLIGKKQSTPLVEGEPWVKDKALSSVTHLQLFDEYLEMVLQFGFVVLFVAAMPLAPMFAMLNNTLELRLDAWKMVALMRRPIARRARDIGAWLGVLASVSALSVVTNAVIVGFTSEQIPKMVYQLTDGNGSLTGYMQWRLSVFSTDDFEAQSVPSAVADRNVSACYYRDFRYAPEHPQRYQYSTSYWHVLAARMGFVLVFEHLVLVLKALVDLLVPDKPAIVKEEMKRERELLRKALFSYKA